jgi:hypothetical protein
MLDNDTIQRASRTRRRDFLKAMGGGTALSLLAGRVGARRTERNEPPMKAHLGASDTQSDIMNAIRDANDGIDFSTSGGGALRNVGFRNRRSAGTQLVTAAVTTAGQSAVIDGCYFGDGGNGPAIYVTPDHAGTLHIRNCYFEGWGDNAVYGSPPGNPPEHSAPGSGGVVTVENCYSKGNAISNYRLGTDGSYIKNCVSVGGQRGYWGIYGKTRVINCDITSGILASDNTWQDPAVVNVENTRFSGGTHLHYSGATINGTSQGQPRDYYPGVPLSPADAQNGNRS